MNEEEFKKKKFKLPLFHAPRARLRQNIILKHLSFPRVRGFTLSGNKIIFAVPAVVLVGFLAALMFVMVRGGEKHPIWPQPGVYEFPFEVGRRLPDSDGLASQTLQLNIGGARVANILIENVSAGKASGLDYAIEIKGNGKSIECTKLSFDKLQTPSFVTGTATFFKLTATDVTVDGISIKPTISNTIQNVAVGSTRSAFDITIKDSTYDRIIIDTGTATSTVANITFSDVRTFGAGVIVGNIQCGELAITNSTIGSGSGIDSPDLSIPATTKVSTSVLTNNIEKPTTVR